MPIVTCAPYECIFADDLIRQVIAPPGDVVLSGIQSLNLHSPIGSSSIVILRRYKTKLCKDSRLNYVCTPVRTVYCLAGSVLGWKQMCEPAAA